MSAQPDTLSIREVAARVGRSHQTLYRAAKATGEVLPGVKVFAIRGTFRVSRLQLDEFLRNPTAKVAS